MLEVDNLNAWYGRSHVLQGVALSVGKGEAVCMIGRNGAGKTTTLRSIMGLVARREGAIRFNGENIIAEPTHRRFALGLAYVPEERRIVPGLTVQDNLRLGLVASANRSREADVIDRIAQTFPRLKERLGQAADTLSGGEQQMLAIARAMAADPKLIMLDEPSEGIMPVLVDEMFELFARMKGEGITLLLVEQNVERALQLADRAYVMDQGAIVHTGDAKTLLADKAIQERYCAV
ncbi:MAG TPA: ABC transporter ATP-binding protein [Beijerinckiaceae bacterium]|jgi:branched-chain amino acid transport system ATP-binding protein|nr:ABC transporter ATP-binding protein [Beijerinckiaceae bacterium]